MKISNFITVSILAGGLAIIHTSCKKDIIDPTYDVEDMDSTFMDSTDYESPDSTDSDTDEEPIDTTYYDDWTDGDTTYTEPGDTL